MRAGGVSPLSKDRVPITMTTTEAESILARYESNLFADLYKSRWDAEYASTVVPNLIKCLEVDDKAILMRTLSALHRIGPESDSAGLFVCPFLEHPDVLVRRNAIYALTAVWHREGHRAVAPLVRVANDTGMLKDVMFNLIALGVAAKPAKKIFIAASRHGVSQGMRVVQAESRCSFSAGTNPGCGTTRDRPTSARASFNRGCA